jgi:predicted KAP-like P-loop ATPase
LEVTTKSKEVVDTMLARRFSFGGRRHEAGFRRAEKVKYADPRSGSRSTEGISLLTRKLAMITQIFRKHVMKAHPARLASIMGRATHCPTLAVACSEIVAAVDTELFP